MLCFSAGRWELKYQRVQKAKLLKAHHIRRASVLSNPKAKRRFELKTAAGRYEHIPSEKSIRSDSRGHESESTDCGSDLLYCLNKINLVCPTVRVKDGTRKSGLLSISSFLTIERRRQQSEIRRQQRRSV